MPLNLAVTDELAEELGPKPAGGPAANPQSVLEALRRRREQLANSQTNDFAVPGYEALDIEGLDEPAALIARYRRLSVEEYNRALFGNRDGTIIERNAQLLIDALGNDDRVGLFWRIGDADPVRCCPATRPAGMTPPRCSSTPPSSGPTCRRPAWCSPCSAATSTPSPTMQSRSESGYRTGTGTPTGASWGGRRAPGSGARGTRRPGRPRPVARAGAG
jgi:hypothetical protein